VINFFADTFFGPALLEKLRQFPISAKVLIVAFVDCALCFGVVLLAHSLRISALSLPNAEVLHLYLIAPLLSILSNAAFGVYWSASRSHSSHTEFRILSAQIAVALAWIVLLWVLGTDGFARSVVFIYVVLAVLEMILLRRFTSEVFSSGEHKYIAKKEPIVIFGAGREGLAALQAIKRHRRFKPVAFIDTDYTMVGRKVSGLPVHGVEDLESVLSQYQPKELILAKSGLARSGRRKLVDQVAGRGVTVKTIPDQMQFLEKDLQFSELKSINVEDLLGRDPVPPDKDLMEAAVKQQVVLVTGAGGSIGSELARQAQAFGPKKLILVDNSEFALFEIHRALESAIASKLVENMILVPVLADVRNEKVISSLMREHGVNIVFHAAAYKHVRMVQENAAAGIDNNIFGTKSVAKAALENGVNRFVLISTDKAVRPTSIMGASKRVAEMIVQSLASENKGKTIFSIVRFGNVLGSTGSVVPLFREQIAKGGPVTVTHPDVTRYFMLIPEAAQLVIQSAAMATGGEVFVLDMGEPVKILDLAETMIELAGLQVKNSSHPLGDIEVKFTGLLNGEKLFEELQIGDDIVATKHALIKNCREKFLTSQQLDKHLRAERVRGSGSTPTGELILKIANFASERQRSND
jgi:FlaA1/EpsC-like NDP-sugar epimerase